MPKYFMLVGADFDTNIMSCMSTLISSIFFVISKSIDGGYDNLFIKKLQTVLVSNF